MSEAVSRLVHLMEAHGIGTDATIAAETVQEAPSEALDDSGRTLQSLLDSDWRESSCGQLPMTPVWRLRAAGLIDPRRVHTAVLSVLTSG
eukprot:7828484-Alexandrium_andersonii.AAC.1